jgi:hypothetical protein
MRYFLITIHQYGQELNFLMLCHTDTNLLDKFNRSTYWEFMSDHSIISELSVWEYQALKNDVMVTHDDADPEFKAAYKYYHRMSGCCTYVNGVWTMTRQSKANLLI